MPAPTDPGFTLIPDSTRLSYIAALMAGIKWGQPDTATTDLSFSFPWTGYASPLFVDANGNPAYYGSSEPVAAYRFGFDAAQQAAVRGALQSWADVANIRFTEVAESAGEVGDLRFGWTSSATTSATGGAAWGWAYYPSSWQPAGGDIWISSTSKGQTSTGWAAGDYNYEALIHEIGHALGLKHPFEGSNSLPEDQNSRLYSIMAYNNAPNSLFVRVVHNADGTVTARGSYINPDTPMLYDIAAMQFLYGANTTHHAGNDVYTFDPETPFLRTLWDGGGTDTISVANFTKGCTIDLQAGHFSSITIPSDSTDGYNWASPPPVATYDGTRNLAIAYDCVIENAIGGSGNDILIGNEANNTLDGGAGNDLLYGGEGSDTAVFHANLADATIYWTADSSILYVISSSGGTDRLSGIETLQFMDARISVAAYINASDIVAPTVRSFSPAPQAAGVGSTSNIVLDFSEAIQRGSGTIKLWNATTSSLVEAFDIATSLNISITGTTLTIDPSAALPADANLLVIFERGNVRDMAGNANDAIAPLRFSTPAAEAAFPRFHITATNQLSEGEAASFTVFLETVITSPVTIYFSTLAGTASTGGGDYAGFSDRAITFTPGGPTSQVVTVQTFTDDLAEASENFRGVVYRAIGDFGSGTYLATSNLVTLLDKTAPDVTPPAVMQFSPSAGASAAGTAADIVLSFSEAIARGTGSILITDSAGKVVANIDAATSGMLSIDGSTLTINPVADLEPATTYRVTLAAGSIKDLLGNPVASLSSYSFTTVSLVAGTDAADHLAGSAAGEVLRGLGDDDSLSGLGGNDTIDGGSGIDTAHYSGRLANYAIHKSGNTYTVQDKTGADGSDLLSNVETLRFADLTVSLTIQSSAAALPAATVEKLVGLYSAFFLRTPDADGLAYWLGQSAAGKSFADIADGFYGAALQYSSLIGISAGMSDTAFINLIYKNALGRTDGADAGGLAYWSEQLGTGKASRGALVLNMLDAAHAYKGDATYGWVADLLDNRIAVGKLLAVDLGLGYADPAAAITNGMAISAAVTMMDTSQALRLVGISPGDIHLA